MADYQYLQTRYWDDGFIMDLTPEEKFFYVYLLTNPQGNILGAFELPVRLMEMHLGYNRETIEKLLARFAQYGKVIYDDATKEVLLTNWLKHNGNRSPKLITPYRKAFGALKSAVIRERLAVLAEEAGIELTPVQRPVSGASHIDTEPEPYREGIDTVSEPHASGTDTVSDGYLCPSDTTTQHNTTQTQHITTSVANATAAEAAPGMPISEQDRKQAVWHAAVDLFAKAGVPEKQARSIVGKHVRDYGNETVEDVIASMVEQQPAEPIAYMTAALKDKPKGGMSRGTPPKQHDLPKTYQKSGRL